MNKNNNNNINNIKNNNLSICQKHYFQKFLENDLKKY